MKTALVLGATGQAASYLIELLLSKQYRVIATRRRTSTPNLSRIEHLLDNPNLSLEWADLLDRESLRNVVQKCQPDEVYNMAAQSDVHVSFLMPEYTRATIKDGTENLIDACLTISKPHKLFLAGSSEMFGNSPAPQNEETLFRPVSPYAMAKATAFRMAQQYRSGMGMWIAQGILFNYESPRRGLSFVTRKITHALGRMACGLQETCALGNLEAKRDWMHARDAVEGMWLCMQQEEPDDFVFATGETHSVREFLEAACLSMATLLDPVCNEAERSMRLEAKFTTDPALFRPAEVHCLQGDASKARRVLGWKPRTTFRELVSEMVRADYELARIEALCKAGANLR